MKPSRGVDAFALSICVLTNAIKSFRQATWQALLSSHDVFACVQYDADYLLDATSMSPARVKLVLLLCAGALIVCCLPVGCRAVYVWNADRAAKPVIRAIDAFKSRTGRLPTTLSELTETNRGKALKLEGHSNVGLVWSVNYRNNSNDSYVVTFNHVHYDVRYENGKRCDVEFNFSDKAPSPSHPLDGGIPSRFHVEHPCPAASDVQR